MLAIEDIAVVEPKTRLSIAEDFASLHIEPLQAKVYSRMYGFSQVPVAGVGDEFPMLEQAVADLFAQAQVDPVRVGVIVHAHTGPYLGPAGASLPRRLSRRFGAHLLCLGMQLHKCVSSLTALEVIDRLLADRPKGTLAVLLIGESADSKDLRVLEMGVAGDMAVAVLLRRDGDGPRVLAQTVHIHGQYAGGIYDDPKAQSRRDYEQRFPQYLQDLLTSTLDKVGARADELRYLLPHNVNVHIWRKAAARLGIGEERLYLANVARFAHCFGADVFLNLAAVRPSLRTGDLCLMAAVGVGGTFGAALIEHR